MESLASLFGKISNYNILNNLIPGAILCVVYKHLVGYDFMNVGTLELLVVFYFTGMINSRIGSLVLEPIMQKIKWVRLRDYRFFVEAAQKDNKLNSLVEVNNMYRSMISVSFTALLVKLYYVGVEQQWNFGNVSDWLLLMAMLVLFAFAYKKQSKYIVSRIDYNTNPSVTK